MNSFCQLCPIGNTFAGQRKHSKLSSIFDRGVMSASEHRFPRSATLKGRDVCSLASLLSFVNAQRIMAADTTEPEVPEDAVGRRVSCKGERATVRFVGEVPPTAGLWLGVEWDDPVRGKHDGRHDGVQYFTCRHPKGGSFVRPAKASFGSDYPAAVRRVYHVDPEAVLGEEISISSKTLEWAAFKERSLESLETVLLTGCEVNGPGADGDIRETTPNVRWLDLSASLLCCWEDVVAISRQLEHLEALQLSCNRLRLPSDPAAHCRAFCNLRVLTLIGCELTWTQILQCAPMWPQLEELIVEDNNITELHRPEGVLQQLKCLNLSKNPVDQDSLLSLAFLPRLEQLNMADTGLSQLHFHDAAAGGQTAMFAALENLNLSRNDISEWHVIDELAKLPALVQLCCRGNPLVSSDRKPETANQIFIAKLGRLEVLNNCKIHPQERRGAEYDYLKMFGEEWLQVRGRSQLSEQFACRHPRYLSLIDKYGAPEEGEVKKRQPFALKNQLLKITFVFVDGDKRPVEKKLPASMEVQKVKGLLSRLIKVPAADLRLSYTSAKVADREFVMDSDLQTLLFYAIDDGDQVLVRWL
ncbi:tubulin-specific chaperone E isoform X1 [Nerophis ophidion]|uniref:tubulin-specific chaperone E isoform X1 n=2 Tax=Nerophis ophidion TaxID=159077 RepID=UPI002AE0808B|nr:tubulin-specific chaperone E isoform X1 [Nerophis ophidion]